MTEVKNQVFQDISKTGKDRKWKERKLKNIELAGQLDILVASLKIFSDYLSY